MTGGLDKRPYPLYNTIMTQTKFDLAIVGGGIAGYTAALVSESLKLNSVWLGEERFGRKLLSAEYVRNYPAVTGSGADFAAVLSAQAEKENVRFTPARIGGIFAAGGEFLLSCGQEAYSARAVILATGVELRGSVKGESEFLGKGVSYCAVCDGALYRGKRVAVFLYDAKYAEEVEYLAGFAARIDCFCLCPAPDFKAENVFSLSERPLEVTGAERVRGAHGGRGGFCGRRVCSEKFHAALRACRRAANGRRSRESCARRLYQLKGAVCRGRRYGEALSVRESGGRGLYGGIFRVRLFKNACKSLNFLLQYSK